MLNFSSSDLDQIKGQGINIEQVEQQIKCFKDGFPFTEINRPCAINDGIYVIPKPNFDMLIEKFEDSCKNSRVMKFVPASGAATRMFKSLLAINGKYEKISKTDMKALADQGDKEAKEVYAFMDKLDKFAFFDDLKAVIQKDKINIESLINQGEYKEIVEYLLTEKGLNYANLPKCLIKFHKYEEEVPRTSFEEHLVEGTTYTKDQDNKVRMHFTISPEHLGKIEKHFAEVKHKYEEKSEVEFIIDFSQQKKCTDTIAVDLDNNPFYDGKKILFRPGGHGALIDNLSDLDADIIFIKNIDNVVPDSIKSTTVVYKKALAGYLLSLQERSFDYLRLLDSGDIDSIKIKEIFDFLELDLFLNIPQDLNDISIEEKKEFLYSKLNRPIRVCGMVKNQGEPGGGPFWVKTTEGESMQIVETSQINMKSDSQKELLSQSTYFNPVDLICGVKDYKGNKFDLKKYIDYNTGFISSKSKDGRDLKALELPGLWNGAMAFWNTVFVEVPIITFNPVKTVNDLLREEHQVL